MALSWAGLAIPWMRTVSVFATLSGSMSPDDPFKRVREKLGLKPR